MDGLEELQVESAQVTCLPPAGPYRGTLLNLLGLSPLMCPGPGGEQKE